MIADYEYLDRIANAANATRCGRDKCKKHGIIDQHYVYLDELSYNETKCAWGIDRILARTERCFKISYDGMDFHIIKRVK